jgi:hypothetical protein
MAQMETLADGEDRNDATGVADEKWMRELMDNSEIYTKYPVSPE